MAKKTKKSSNVPIIYKSNSDWKKTGKLLFVAILSALLSFIFIINLPKIIKNVTKIKLAKSINKPKRQLEFSTNTNLSYFDPAYLINDLSDDNLNYLLVDTRSTEEFKLGHIKSAVNAPLYSDYRQIEQSKTKLSDFKKNIINFNKKNEIVILYGYFSKSQIMIDAALYLLNNNIKTQLLSISWYEFKNNPFSWIPGNDIGVSEINKYLEGAMYEDK